MEKTEQTLKNEESRDNGNNGHIRHTLNRNKKQSKTHITAHNAKNNVKTDSNKYLGWTQVQAVPATYETPTMLQTNIV